ncbi:hypothetical protein [Aerococcus urinaeequi]|uniref:hypothetical protein n=1 Tax=Aerococcus urinaeequi TaxID=51665 RepID=UPI003D6A09BB
MEKTDYCVLLEDLETELNLIYEMKNSSLETSYLEDAPIKLKTSVKNFAGNVESVLDYLSWHIFEKAYLPRLKEQKVSQEEIENKMRCISFPNKKDRKKNSFYKQMENMFPNINNEFPNLYDSIEQVQPYNYDKLMDSWLYLANKIANDTKHRSLIRIDSRESMSIEYLELPGNNTFSNIRIEGAKHSIVIGDQPLTKENANELGVKEFRGDIESYYLINGLNLPLYKTLKMIFDELSITVEDIEKHIPTK